MCNELAVEVGFTEESISIPEGSGEEVCVAILSPMEVNSGVSPMEVYSGVNIGVLVSLQNSTVEGIICTTTIMVRFVFK